MSSNDIVQYLENYSTIVDDMGWSGWIASGSPNIQDNLLQIPPDSLEDERKVAKRLEEHRTRSDCGDSRRSSFVGSCSTEHYSSSEVGGTDDHNTVTNSDAGFPDGGTTTQKYKSRGAPCHNPKLITVLTSKWVCSTLYLDIRWGVTVPPGESLHP